MTSLAEDRTRPDRGQDDRRQDDRREIDADLKGVVIAIHQE
jgi:hypothetical protein